MTKASVKDKPCRGCEHCKGGVVSPRAIVDFEDEEALEAFWKRHVLAEGSVAHMQLSPKGERHLDDIRKRLGEKKLRVTMMLDPWLKEGLEELAEPLGIGYQTLAQIYLAQRVTREFQKTPKRQAARRGSKHQRA